eukprot:747117-Hanusia_phi.AAC.2
MDGSEAYRSVGVARCLLMLKYIASALNLLESKKSEVRSDCSPSVGMSHSLLFMSAWTSSSSSQFPNPFPPPSRLVLPPSPTLPCSVPAHRPDM